MKAISELTVKVSKDRTHHVEKEEYGRLFVRSLSELKVKLFADGADRAQIVAAGANPLIQGFTTNPTLMRAAGVKDYEAFARGVLEVITDRPISFEVFADEFSEMERQARKIASWAENVYV
jgi:transaldolase